MTIKDLSAADYGSWRDFWNSEHGKKWMAVLESRVREESEGCYRMTGLSDISSEYIARIASCARGQEQIVDFIKQTAEIKNKQHFYIV